MLQSLTIRNVALIEDITIFFHTGLEVLSGETGAGKSIVVDAVSLILGGRADRTMIRSGCDKASVEAVFDLPEPGPIPDIFEQEGIEFDGRTVTVYREITAGGKNICRICGMIMPVSFLKDISGYIINLHGQSEYQILTDPDSHLSFLDRTGNRDHQEKMELVRQAYSRFIENHRAYAALVRKNKEKEQRMYQLKRDINILRKAHLKTGEEEALIEEIKMLEKNKKLSNALKQANSWMNSSDVSDTGNTGRMSVTGTLKMVVQTLRTISDESPKIQTLSERFNNIYYDLEDLAFQLSKATEENNYDSGKLEKTENRLDLIRQVKKQFATTEEEVLKIQEKLENEYSELEGLEDTIEKTAIEHKKLLIAYREAARELNESRVHLAEDFKDRMMLELRDLGMENTRFEVHFFQDNNKPKMPTEKGDDQAEFMISPNPGEPLMPMAKIASGGELSRLMLAMKVLESDHAGTDCMVFDEIDTGISGKMAQTVASKMMKISRKHQVICVSHLPQLAAAGDHHYLVSKTSSGQRTVTNVEELDRNGRIKEIARMISGADGISDDAVIYSDGMLKAAERIRKENVLH